MTVEWWAVLCEVGEEAGTLPANRFTDLPATFSFPLTSRPDLPSPTGLPGRLLVFLTPSTGLLSGKTFLLDFEKMSFLVLNSIPDFFWCVDSLSGE